VTNLLSEIHSFSLPWDVGTRLSDDFDRPMMRIHGFSNRELRIKKNTNLIDLNTLTLF
jgi:hypothetical protein